MITVKINNNTILSRDILSIPEFVYSLGFEQQFFLEPIQIELNNKHGYYANKGKNIYGNNPNRCSVTLYDNNNLIYSGKIFNIIEGEYKTITLELKPELDLETKISDHGLTSFKYLINDLIGNNIVDQYSLNYIDGYLDGSFGFIGSESSTVMELLNDIILKCGIYVHINKLNKIAFHTMYSTYNSYPSAMLQIYKSQVYNIENDNSKQDLVNQYSINYIGGQSSYFGDDNRYKESRLIHGTVIRDSIDATTGLTFGNKDTARKCMQNHCDRFSKVFERKTIEMKESTARYLNQGNVINYDGYDWQVYSLSKGYNNLTSNIILHSLNINNKE